MADLDSTEVRQRISDIREWIFEAVDKIGAPMQYITIEGGTEDYPLLQIQDNQVPLPSDLVVLDGVAFSESEKGPWVPMTVTTSIFREPKRKHNRPAEPHQPMQYKMQTTLGQMYTHNLNKYYERAIINNDHKPEYFIKPGWLVTNKSKGFIKLAYKAIAVDERGYPLIPDLTSYQEAIYWYVVMKLSFPKWYNGGLGGNSKYAQKYAANMFQYTQQQWNFYRNQAYAEAMMPTADDMRAIKNEWNRLVPEFESDDTFFRDDNKRELIYNDYYNGY